MYFGFFFRFFFFVVDVEAAFSSHATNVVTKRCLAVIIHQITNASARELDSFSYRCQFWNLDNTIMKSLPWIHTGTNTLTTQSECSCGQTNFECVSLEWFSLCRNRRCRKISAFWIFLLSFGYIPLELPSHPSFHLSSSQTFWCFGAKKKLISLDHFTGAEMCGTHIVVADVINVLRMISRF